MFEIKIAVARIIYRLFVALAAFRVAVHSAEGRALATQNSIRERAFHDATVARIRVTQDAVATARAIAAAEAADLAAIAAKAGRL